MKIVQPPRKRCRLSIMSCTHGVRMLSFHPCTTKAYFSLVLQPNCVNLVSSDDTNWSPVLERNKIVRLSDNDEKFLSESSRVDKKLYKLQKFLFFSLAKLKPLSVINEWKWECSCCCRMTFNMFPHFSFNYELWDLFFSQFTFSSSEMILQTKVEITRFVVFYYLTSVDMGWSVTMLRLVSFASIIKICYFIDSIFCEAFAMASSPPHHATNLSHCKSLLCKHCKCDCFFDSTLHKHCANCYYKHVAKDFRQHLTR